MQGEGKNGESEMTDEDDWQAAQHRDECLRIEQGVKILAASTTRPLTEEEAMILGYECGFPNEVYKELHDARGR